MGITWFVVLARFVIGWAWSVIGLSFCSRPGINYAYQNGVVELECLAKNSNIRVRNRVWDCYVARFDATALLTSTFHRYRPSHWTQ